MKSVWQNKSFYLIGLFLIIAIGFLFHDRFEDSPQPIQNPQDLNPSAIIMASSDSSLGHEIKNIKFTVFGITRIVSSPDQSKLVLQYKKPGVVKISDVPDTDSSQDFLLIYDLAHDKILCDIPGRSNQFDHFGNYIVRINGESGSDFTLNPMNSVSTAGCDIETKNESGGLTGYQFQNNVEILAISHDGTTLVRYLNKSADIYETGGRKLVTRIPNLMYASSERAALYIDSERSLIIGVGDCDYVTVWNYTENKKIIDFYSNRPTDTRRCVMDYNQLTGTILAATNSYPYQSVTAINDPLYLALKKLQNEPQNNTFDAPNIKNIDTALIALDVKTGNQKMAYPGFKANVSTIAISPDGQLIAASQGLKFRTHLISPFNKQEYKDFPSYITVWSSNSGNILRYTYLGDGVAVSGMTFSSDGKELIYSLGSDIHVVDLNLVPIQ